MATNGEILVSKAKSLYANAPDTGAISSPVLKQ